MGEPSTQSPEHFGIGRLFWLMSDAIVGADISTERIVLWNPAASALFGYSEAEALGMPLAQLVPDDLRQPHLAGVRRYREGGAPAIVGAAAVEVKAVDKGGALRDVALTLADVSEGTERRYVVAVIRDVSELRQAQNDLQRMNDSMREFVATASHDLRTPLASMMGFAAALVEDDDLDAAQRRTFAEAVLRGVQRASRLVDDLLTVSQIQAGVLATTDEVSSVAAAVEEAARMLDLTVVSDVAELVVAVDPVHLSRILANYLSNAARHGAPPIEVHAAVVEDGVAEIVVVDHGDGVPAEFRSRLFETFARASSLSTDGTGLGLSIVRGITRAYGGDAYYQSGDDGGARFSARLPMVRGSG